MTTLKATRDFNNGKGIVKKKGDTITCDEHTAKRLIGQKFAKKVDTSHKSQTKK